MKIKKIKLFLILAISCQTAFNQEKSNDVLISIDNHQITKDEFLRIYHKNNQNTIDKKSTEEYLDLFINFKLKVIEAEDKGLDTLSSFKKELNGYRKQLANKYFSDEELEEQLKKEAYEKMKYALNVSHILFTIDRNAAPKDTLEVYNKAIKVRKRLLSGEDFAKVAKEISEDKNVIYNDGNLGYMSVFKAPYPFETNAYSLKENEISMPVRDVNGYHIIKVNKIIKSPGQLKVAHIAIAAPKTASPTDVNNAKDEIIKLYDSIKNGADFAEMARKYSIDKQSASKGGELPWFIPGTFVPEFEELCFNMKDTGELAGPVRTYFGWHIIKLLGKQPLRDYDEIKNDIGKRIKQDPVRKEFINKAIETKIEKEFGFKAYSSNIEPFYSLVDSLTYLGKWDTNKGKGLKKVLFSIGDTKYTQQDFNNYLAKNIKKSPNIPKETLINNIYNIALREAVFGYKDSQLENQFVDFKNLMQEYHDGILLFELTDKMVWSKAIQDTLGLESFYNQHKDKYMWKQRVDADIYTCDNNEIANLALKVAEKKAKKGYSNQEVIDKVCADENKKCIDIENGLYEKKDNNLIGQINWELGLSKIIIIDNKPEFAYINKIIEPQTKKFNEAKGIVTADYQDLLEKEWIKTLREKYDVTINKKVLSTIE